MRAYDPALSGIRPLNAKTGWREVEIGRGSKDQNCPVHALEQWLHYAKIDFGPVFVGTSHDGKRASETRLNDKHVARLIKRATKNSAITVTQIRSQSSKNPNYGPFQRHEASLLIPGMPPREIL